MLQFEWDEENRLNNIKKHAIDIQDAVSIFEGVTLTFPDERFKTVYCNWLDEGICDCCGLCRTAGNNTDHFSKKGNEI